MTSTLTPSPNPEPRPGRDTRNPLNLALVQCPQQQRVEPEHPPVRLRVNDEDGHHVGAVGHGDNLVDELGGSGDADYVPFVELLRVRGFIWVLIYCWGLKRGRGEGPYCHRD